MRRAAGVVLVAAAIFAPSTGAVTGLSVSPLRLSLTAKSGGAIVVRNPSGRPLFLGVSRAGFSRTLRGRPLVRAARGAAGWLRVRPRRLRLAPHATGTLRVTALPPPGATAGDHPALVLLGSQQPGERRVRVLLRVGVVVLVHVPGPTVRQLEPEGITIEHLRNGRLFELRLVNRGNVIEAPRLQLELERHGREMTALRARRLELLPHSAGLAEFVYRGGLRGRVVARVLGRAYRLRL